MKPQKDFLKISQRTSSDNQRKEKVSIIIPAHNEEAYLKSTLESLFRQKIKDNLEILVIANGCTDNTVEIAKRLGVVVIELPKPGMNIARNLGAQRASGELLIFLDADTRASENLVMEALRVFKKDPNAVMICPVYPDIASFFAQFLMKIKNFLHWLGMRYGGSGIIICPKSLFFQIEGFNPTKEIFEIRDFLKRACNGRRYYYLKNTYVITSMRRYKRRGYLFWLWFWIKSLFFRWCKKDEIISYPAVR